MPQMGVPSASDTMTALYESYVGKGLAWRLRYSVPRFAAGPRWGAAGKVAGQLSTLINPLLSHISDSNPPTNRL